MLFKSLNFQVLVLIFLLYFVMEDEKLIQLVIQNAVLYGILYQSLDLVPVFPHDNINGNAISSDSACHVFHATL